MKKIVKIENYVELWADECAISYAQISNAICASETLAELRDAMGLLIIDTEVGKYFKWGYDTNFFWLKQRVEYMDKETNDFNTLTVEFR